MTKEERDEQQAIVRVGLNLGVLLDVGLFEGKHATGLAECKGLVKAIVESAQAKLVALEPPPANDSPKPDAPSA